MGVYGITRENAELRKENETLTRDNLELGGQIQAIKQAALRLGKIYLPAAPDEDQSVEIACLLCEHYVCLDQELDFSIECDECREKYNFQNWQPPSAEN